MIVVPKGKICYNSIKLINSLSTGILYIYITILVKYHNTFLEGRISLKVAICDDEKNCRELIIEYISQNNHENLYPIISEFCCSEDLLDAYKNGERFDLIFFDIEMKTISGVEAGKKIRNFDKNVLFIFITSHQQYVPDAFTLNAFQFLTKPVKKPVFDREFERAVKTFRRMKFKYRITYKEQTNILQIEDILYIETYDRHLRAITMDSSYEFLGSIGAEEEKLSQYNFIRCHKSFLINMYHIKNIDRNSATMANNDSVPISKHSRSYVMENFNKFISGGCL